MKIILYIFIIGAFGFLKIIVVIVKHLGDYTRKFGYYMGKGIYFLRLPIYKKYRLMLREKKNNPKPVKVSSKVFIEKIDNDNIVGTSRTIFQEAILKNSIEPNEVIILSLENEDEMDEDINKTENFEIENENITEKELLEEEYRYNENNILNDDDDGVSIEEIEQTSRAFLHNDKSVSENVIARTLNKINNTQLFDYIIINNECLEKGNDLIFKKYGYYLDGNTGKKEDPDKPEFKIDDFIE